MAKKVTLKDNEDTVVYPQTVTEAVYNSDGDGLDELIGSYDDVPEYVSVVTDANDRIIEGTDVNGAKHFLVDVKIEGSLKANGVDADLSGSEVSVKSISVDKTLISGDENAEGNVEMTTDVNDKILSYRDKRGVLHEPAGIETDNIKLSDEGLDELRDELGVIPQQDIDGLTEIAGGNLTAFGTYQSELDASPVVNNSNDAYVGYYRGKQKNKSDQQELVVGINHDDLPKSDYLGTRRVYNKYGFNATFNFILFPFANANEKKERIEGIKKLVKDGNDIGLHACLGKTYWLLNRWVGFSPDGGLMYGPFLDDLKGDNVDGTGTNVFGDTITATTTLADIGFKDAPNKTTKVVEATGEDVLSAMMAYSWYGRKTTTTGLDLDDVAVTKTDLEWMEYWYNNLIDGTLGYSANTVDPLEQFDEDYEIPESADIDDYYPDAEHLRTGKIVFFDDTTNPHYSDSSYQKVGRFKKGLFKGCASCCNYEVFDRCIDVAAAFVRHYFDLQGFSLCHPHGVSYFTKTLAYNNLLYVDSAKHLLYYASGKLYMSRLGRYLSPFDMFISRGIRCCGDSVLSTARKNYIVHAYGPSMYGQNQVKATGFSKAGFVNYLESFGTTAAQPMSYADFSAFMSGVDNWTKFIIENRGKTITRNDKTYTVFSYLAEAINCIRSCMSTGEIPLLSIDTITLNPGTITAIDLLLRFCYLNNFKVVPFEKARQSSLPDKKIKENYFPNPQFNQSLLRTIGESDDIMIRLPDGWKHEYNTGSVQLDVIADTIESAAQKAMKVTTSANQSCEFTTSVYNLPAGTYRLTMFAKKGNNSMYIKVREIYGNTLASFQNADVVLDERLTGYIDTYKEISYDFVVPEPRRNPDNMSDDVNQACGGYEDNFIRLLIDVYCGSDGYLSVGNCSLRRIQ